jgi:DNA polymerase III delta prime subunit
MHHAFVIEAEAEEGITFARAWVEEELGMSAGDNPDIITLQYGLLTVEDARRICERAAGGAFAGARKALIIAASRAYHEAQNALLKIFEEPPEGVVLFLILPSLGGLLPTLRSRVQTLDSNVRLTKSNIPEIAEEFAKAGQEKRSTIIKRLTGGKDEEKKRELRDEAVALVNGIESLAYARHHLGGETAALLSDIAAVRPYLYDRSAPVKLILEHLALVIPEDLV